MAVGRLGAQAPAANTDTLLYQAPAGKMATVSVCATNRSASVEAQARLALSTSASTSPANSDYLEHDALVSVSSPLERSGVVVGPEQKLFVRADTANVSFVAYGIEGDA